MDRRFDSTAGGMFFFGAALRFLDKHVCNISFTRARVQELFSSDTIVVTGHDGRAYRLLRLHLRGDAGEGAEHAAAVYFCRPQVRSVLMSSADARVRAAHETVSGRAKQEQDALHFEWSLAAMDTLDDDSAAAMPRARPAPFHSINAQLLQLFKAAKLVGASVNLSNNVQIWTARHVHELLLQLGERADIANQFLDAASQPRGMPLSGTDFVELGGTGPMSYVVPMPPSLPTVLRLPPDSGRQYAIPAGALGAEWANMQSWLTDAINLDRSGRALQPTTLAKTENSIRRVLGFAYHLFLDGRAVAMAAAGGGTRPAYSLLALADGSMLAAYVRFSLEIRKKAVDSICSELEDTARVLRCLLRQATQAGDKEQLELLVATINRLCCQLRALPAARAAPPTLEELTDAGKYVDVATIWLDIDARFDELAPLVADAHDDNRLRTQPLARRVHDVLMLLVCLREYPVRRPGCMQAIKVPGSAAPCDWPGCLAPGCRGNVWLHSAAGGGWQLRLVHFKTAGTHPVSIDQVPANSRTGTLLAAYFGWARAALVTVDTDAMWLSARGRALTGGGFGEYLPGLLRGLASKITWTALRHIVATGLIPHVNEGELAGLATAMQTSVRKLTEVYDWQKAERQRAAGLVAYRRASGHAAADARAAAQEEAIFRGEPAGAAEILTELATAEDDGGFLGLGGVEPDDEADYQRGEAEAYDEVERAEAAGAPELQLAEVAPPFAEFLIGCRPRAPPRPAGPSRPRGAPVLFRARAGRSFLTRDQVKQLELAGQGKALRAAFEWLYGKATTSSNLVWIRRKLQGDGAAPG